MSDTPMVERLARVICEANSGPFDFLSEDGKEACRREARAVLQELREPDEAMKEAGMQDDGAGWRIHAYEAETTWQAMIDAALEGK